MAGAPWLSRLFLWEPKHKNPDSRLGVVVKRTYDLAPGARLAPSDAPYPLFDGDVYFGKPNETSIQHEGDLTPFKPATDVVVNARAWARRGAPTRELRVAVAIPTARTRKKLV